MPYWWDYNNDLVDARPVAAPAIPAHQLTALYRHAPDALDATTRRAWAPLVAPTPTEARPSNRTTTRRSHRPPVQLRAAVRFGRLVGLAAGLLVSVIAARVAYVVMGSDGTVVPLLIGAAAGEASGLVLGRFFALWAAETVARNLIGGHR